MKPALHIVEDVAKRASELLCTEIGRTIQRSGRCRLGLSGGSTPRPILVRLRAMLPPSVYPHLRVTWVDERHLPLEAVGDPAWMRHPQESNLRLAYECWLGRLPQPPAVVLPMSTGMPLDKDVARFRRYFQDDFDEGLDVVLLGAGPDGHIASLFPGHAALESPGTCVAVEDSPKPPPSRITLTLPVLGTAHAVILAASGAAKAPMLARAWSGDAALPLGRMSAAGTYYWVLDAAAAARLSED